MKRLLFLLLFPCALLAQNVRVDGVALGPRGPIPNATVAFCAQPANTSTQPCSPVISACSSLTDATCVSPNPVTADSLGNYHVYFSTAKQPFTVQIYGPQVAAPLVLPDQTAPNVATTIAVITPGGSDVGIQVNAAISALPVVSGFHCGEVYIPAGVYSQATSIVMPRCVKLHGATGSGTILTYSPTTGCAIVAADGNTGGVSYSPAGAIEDLTLGGPGSGTSTCGIYLGGSDGSATAPSTGIDPAVNAGDHVNINRVKIYKGNPSSGSGFGIGIQWGNNAWSNTIFESVVSFNGVGLFLPPNPAQITNSGEDISILNSSISNNVGIGLQIGNGQNINVTVANSSFDFNGSWAAQNCTVSCSQVLAIVNSYLLANDHWLQNFGITNLTNLYASGGSNSGTLGYLIDNEVQDLTVTGGQFQNSGAGVILNAASAGSVWFGAFTSGPGALTSSGASVIDRFGNATLSNVLTGGVLTGGTAFNQTVAGKYAGVSACSGGTKAISFGITYTSQPAIILFDETTKGGINITAKSTSGFTASCTGATDAFDWVAIGNPN